MQPTIKEINKKESCCGCGVCMISCPKQAIQMQYDEDGIIYPCINESVCVHCGLCVKICVFGKMKANYPMRGYAVASILEQHIIKSASGGAFAGIATEFLKNSGYVCGAAMKFQDGKVRIEHIIIDSVERLELLQGSKYVQSDITNILPEIKRLLNSGNKVLFSGTPCQVAEIKRFGNNDPNLFTIDLVCHGVPSQKIFSEYVKILGRKYRGKVIDFKFRDKKYGGGGKNGSLMIDDDTTITEKILQCSNSSYYNLFINNNLQRTSCYHCPYAKPERCSDITLGDFWEIEKSNPELLQSHGGGFNENNGISCVLINTEKGQELFNYASKNFLIRTVMIESIINGNTQLRHPVKVGRKRKMVCLLYRMGGGEYWPVDNLFELRKKLKKIINGLKK